MEVTMSASTIENTAIPSGFEARILNEGYGSGAWHGPDLKAALADVTPEQSAWRPAKGRHNIGEIALHHAYCVHAVRAQLSASPIDPFVLDGQGWFEVSTATTPLSWREIQATVEAEHRQLLALVEAIESGASASPLPAEERRPLVLGITCHAIYHAGQIQLIKRLRGE
jgi:hypothetical protein